MAFHPYLFFGGNCREAFTRYQEVLGGDLRFVTAAEMPGNEMANDDQGHLIMHAALTVDGHLLMGSDDPTTDDFGPVQGMVVHYEAPDVAAATRVFAQLADGGEVRVEMGPTEWSPSFGMCVDRFGTPWMVDAPAIEDA